MSNPSTRQPSILYALPLIVLCMDTLFFLSVSVWCLWDHEVFRSALYAAIGAVNGIAVGAVAQLVRNDT